METIIEKIKKVKRLAEAGEMAESISAKVFLEKLLKKHGLTISDLENEDRKERVFKIKSKDHQLFIQIALSVIGNRVFKGSNTKNLKHVFFNVSDIEYMEIVVRYEFHSNLYEKELKSILQKSFRAYLAKHNLYNIEESLDENIDKTKISHDEIQEIINLKDMLSDNYFSKQIGNNG